MHLFLWTLVCHKCHHLWRSQSSKFGAKLPLRPCYWEKNTQKLFWPTRCFTNLREALWWHPGSSSDRILFEELLRMKPCPSHKCVFILGCSQPLGIVLTFPVDVIRDDDSILNFSMYTLCIYIYIQYVIYAYIYHIYLYSWNNQGIKQPFQKKRLRCDWLQMDETPSTDDGEPSTIPKVVWWNLQRDLAMLGLNMGQDTSMED